MEDVNHADWTCVLQTKELATLVLKHDSAVCLISLNFKSSDLRGLNVITLMTSLKHLILAFFFSWFSSLFLFTPLHMTRWPLTRWFLWFVARWREQETGTFLEFRAITSLISDPNHAGIELKISDTLEENNVSVFKGWFSKLSKGVKSRLFMKRLGMSHSFERFVRFVSNSLDCTTTWNTRFSKNGPGVLTQIRAGVTDGPEQVPREGIYDNRLRAGFVTCRLCTQ